MILNFRRVVGKGWEWADAISIDICPIENLPTFIDTNLSQLPVSTYLWNLINTKNYWKQKKRLCVRLRSGDKHHLRKSSDRKAQNQSGDQNERLPDLCFSICRFSQVVFIPRAQPHAQSLFLFPIVYGINLIHFFDEEKGGSAENSIASFGASIPCHAIWQKRRRMLTVSKSATYLATESVNSAPFKRGVPEKGANFWQGKVQNSSPILMYKFLARKSAKLIANLLSDVTSLSLSLSLSLSVSLSLSLSPSAPHAQYRKRFRASYNNV